MIELIVQEAAEVMGAQLVGEHRADVWTRVFPPVSTDTRTLAPGQCFVCLKGPRFNAHDFVGQALEKGASVVVHSDDLPASVLRPGVVFLQVADTLSALQTLAHYARRKWGGTLVGVTGSAGKTTTRAFISALLGRKYRVMQSSGNLNNEIGLPLSLLGIAPEHEVAVIELGMNHAGEIRALARIALPDCAVLTNVGPVHLEFFDSVADIAQAKAEILEFLPAKGRIVFNGDDEHLARVVRNHPVRKVSFGSSEEADVRIIGYKLHDLSRMDFTAVVRGSELSASVPFAGKYFLYNIAAALATAVDMGVSLEELGQGLKELEPVRMRGRLLRVKRGRLTGVTVWDDSYNANPHAVASVLETIKELRGFQRKIVALGTMLELGRHSAELHRDIGAKIAASGVDLLLAVGSESAFLCQGAHAAGMTSDRLLEFEGAKPAGDYLVAQLRPGDLVLVKGSRGIGMDLAVRQIEAVEET